jgi:RNA polymerase sigma-70 factor (ECF subfamily)
VTDDELVRLARQGDTDAFDQLVIRHQAAAYRAALAALRSPQDAEEAAQDAFVRAWSRLDRFRGDASFRTWLLTIVWNCALTRRRSLGRWWRRHAALDHATEVAAPDATVETPVRELRQHAANAIEKLSPKLRDALLLAQSGEYDYATTAAMLGIPVGTLKWRVSEARHKVRAHLATLGYVDAR